MPKPLVAGDFATFSEQEVALGRALFFDPVLSGNRNISCATCHNPAYGGSDGLALGIGAGGTGQGTDRQMGQALQRQARNAPALWDLGAHQVRRLFHDGRVEQQGAVIRSPAGEHLPEGLKSLLAAQVLFPLIAHTEMAGPPESNEIAAAVLKGAPDAWGAIAKRVGAVASYRQLAGQAEIDIAGIANALAAYISTTFRTNGSDFDRYLAGERSALDADQRAGMALFYGAAQCSQCHSGPLLSDQAFHNLAVPPLGPGRTRRFDPVARDTGRLAVTDRIEDSYRFRTPFLRNVAQTAPYGHNGVFPTLNAVIRHHMNPLESLDSFSVPEGIGHYVDATELRRRRAAFEAYPPKAQVPTTLSQRQVEQLIRFLNSLSAPQ
ncbi:cytochrome-c peroxidase [Neptunicoccus cionae]|uniref:cytochrome-c peroxidase n=1 Tax=Neptunicoccus cionae TaxID=2035344 RepID=UPI002570C233|nr:cytochrome c peroxidase [Amylibacter cionae]